MAKKKRAPKSPTDRAGQTSAKDAARGITERRVAKDANRKPGKNISDITKIVMSTKHEYIVLCEKCLTACSLDSLICIIEDFGCVLICLECWRITELHDEPFLDWN